MATPNRWAPWIEPAAGLNIAAQTINSATFAALTGCSLTVAPHVNSRLSIQATVRAQCTLYGGQPLIVRILASTGGGIAHATFDPTAINGRVSLPLLAVFDAVKATSYTFTLEAALLVAGVSTYNIMGTALQGSTQISLIAMPNIRR